ncbi:MAG: methyltransferase domain-containing protein [Candidatus Gastranaerophilales bacterium]|nr:methyltransferase domain-containing protein [Candidatus Gastranaerophilales bacterium]
MSEICENWSTWLKKTRFSYMNEVQVQQTLNWLLAIRNQVLALADIKKGQKVADFGCGSGLLGFGVIEKFSDSVELIFSDKFQDCLDECSNILKTITTPSNVQFLLSDVADIKLESNYLDRAMTRSVLVHVKEKQPVFNEFYRILKPSGMYCAFEPIISENTRYYELTNSSQISDYEDFKKAEKEFMENPNDPLVNFNANSLDKNLIDAGFSDVKVEVQIVASKYTPSKEAIISWFIAPPAPDQKTMKERFLDYFEEKKVDNFILEVQDALANNEISVSSNTALIKAIK